MSIPSVSRRSDARLAAGLLLAASLGAGCRGRQATPNVLLITMDTTRADHLGCYGYGKPTTPNIDALAAESALFTHAFATNPITLPSHSSIMTGTYPLFHGARDNTTYVLRDDVTTLAEVLASRGYDTAAFVSSFVLDSRFNLDQGFALYDDHIEAAWSKDEIAAQAAHAFGFGFEERKASVTTAPVVEWLRKPRRQPFFAWVHYFDPHHPMNPPEPQRSRFESPYDGEIAFVDEQIGKLLEVLRQQRRYDDTLVVVTADHGEGLMDHGEPSHSLLIFDTTMHVPLILKVPGEKPGLRVETLASSVDIMPTILTALGVPVPHEVQGVSLLPWLRGAPPDRHRQIYMESLVGRLTCGWGELRGLHSLDEKLIWGPKPRLYRVGSDPGEVYDLAEREPESVARLKAQLQAALHTWGRPAVDPASMAAPDAETLRKLASLGYVAGSPQAARGVTESLDGQEGRVDPHQKQRVFDTWALALDDLQGQMPFEGIRKLEGVVSEDPGNTIALTTLATAYMLEAHQPKRAAELYQRSLALDPYQESAHLRLARLLRLDKDYAGAERHLRAILEFAPRSVDALTELGHVLRAQARDEEARTCFELAAEIAPRDLDALLALGVLHAQAKRHDEAGVYLKRALALGPAGPELLYNVGIWYLQGGDVKAAISSLSRAAAQAPRSADVQYVLGKLLYEQGETQQARQALERARALTKDADRLARIDQMLANSQPGAAAGP